MLVLQIMGVIAQFERALMVERTKAGLAAAQGRVGGNPALLPGADAWLAIVHRLRPAQPVRTESLVCTRGR